MTCARIGFIGVGAFISARHLRSAVRSELCDIHALCDINETLLEERRQQYQPAYVTTDADELFADKNIDVLVIGTKQDLHAQMAIKALEAGKWAYVEKPIGETREQFMRVVEAEAASPGRIAVGHNRRFCRGFDDMRRIMAQQDGPMFVNYRLMNPSLDKDEGYYAQREKVLYEGCHNFDLANFLIGRYPVGIYASGDTKRNTCCIVEYDDGSRFHFMIGSMGTMQLEKEYAEAFRGYASVTVRDFADVRIRGVPGEYDRLDPESYLCFEQAERLAHQYGSDFLDVLRAETIMREVHEGRISGSAYRDLPWEHVRREGLDDEAYRQIPQVIDSAMQMDAERGRMELARGDSGWFAALEHFVRCYLNGETPHNADALDASVACVTALGAIESVKSQQRVDLTGETLIGRRNGPTNVIGS